MPWIHKRLRGAKIWVRCDETGAPLAGPDGRAEVLYQKRGKIYRAAVRNLEPDDDPAVISDEEAAPSGLAEPKPAPPSNGAANGSAPARSRPGHIPNGTVLGTTKVLPHANDVIHVYTDGACTGNPGPMGLGVVILDGSERKELSEYLGMGTNNIAELTAILRGLTEVPRDRPVVVYSDSAYALGILGKGWKAKANQELIARLRGVFAEFTNVRLVKVAGHAGVSENERCDELARTAVVRRR